MASVAAVALKEGILPLKSSFSPDDLRAAKIEHSWTTTGPNGREKHTKMYLPMCDNPSNKESFLCVVDAFLDAAHSERLHLADGASRHSKFRQVLGGALRASWQIISDARGNAKTVDNFCEDVRTLVDEHLSPTSHEDQLSCLAAATEPCEVSCEALGARFRVVNRLGNIH